MDEDLLSNRLTHSKNKEMRNMDNYGTTDAHIDHGSNSDCDTNDETPRLPRDTKHSAIKLIFAYFVCISAIIFRSASVALAELLGNSTPPFQLNLWRCLMEIAVITPWIVYRKCDLTIERSQLPLTLSLFVIENLVDVVYYTAPVYIAVGTANGIVNSFILLFCALLSICVKSERRLVLFLATLVAMLGTVLMVQPTTWFSGTKISAGNWTMDCDTITSNSSLIMDLFGHNVHGKQWLGVTLSILAALLWTANIYGLQRLVKEVDPINYVFWDAMAGIPLSLVCMLAFENPVIVLNHQCILNLMLHLLGSTLMTVVLPFVLKILPAAVYALLDTLDTVILVLLQYTILKNVQPGFNNWVEILGACVCLVGIIMEPVWELIAAYCADMSDEGWEETHQLLRARLRCCFKDRFLMNDESTVLTRKDKDRTD